MDLILIVGPQAVGKMTVGKALENKIDAKLLFNHETLDIFARFLGYTRETFELSDWMRKKLFKAFAENTQTNQTKGIIFTVLVGFDAKEDFEFLQEISNIFLNRDGKVYFVELEAELEERLKRNRTELRLQEKPSKRDFVFSENELLTSMEKHRLNSFEGEVEEKMEGIRYLKINNSNLSPEVVAETIQQWISNKKA